MTIYQDLKEAGFEESSKGPIILSGLVEVIEGLEASRIPFAILPGDLVPEAKSNEYDSDTFKRNYIVFLK